MTNEKIKLLKKLLKEYRGNTPIDINIPFKGFLDVKISYIESDDQTSLEIQSASAGSIKGVDLLKLVLNSIQKELRNSGIKYKKQGSKLFFDTQRKNDIIEMIKKLNSKPVYLTHTI